MRGSPPFLACMLFACGLGAGEAPPPGAMRLLDDANAAVAKARQTYETAQQKERDRLAAALVKEQDRETRAGNLDTALAIKALIAEVKAGRQPVVAAPVAPVTAEELLGDGPVTKPAPVPVQATVGVPVAAILTIDRRVATTPAVIPADCPAELRQSLAGTTMISMVRTDTTRLACVVASGGLVAIATGSSPTNNAEVWAEAKKSGFVLLNQGSDYTWFTLHAKAGATFPFYGSPRAVYPVLLFAKTITPTP